MNHAWGIFALASLGLCASGCNQIFGLGPEITTQGAGGSAASGGGAGGEGGAAEPCAPERVPACHEDGGSAQPCEPLAVTPYNAQYTLGLTVVGENVYWADLKGSIASTSYDGSAKNMFGSADGASASVAANATHIFWTERDGSVIHGAILDETHALVDVSKMVGDTPEGAVAGFGRIAVHGETLAWVGSRPNAVWMAKATGEPSAAIKVADKRDDTLSAAGSVGVAVDDEHIYWTDAGKIRRIPIEHAGDEAKIEDFFTDAAALGASEIAVDGARVYWTGADGVASLTKDRKDLVRVVMPGHPARALLLDGAYVYWAADAGTILRAKRGGGTETLSTLTTKATRVYALAADCGALFYSTFQNDLGTIYRLRKPE